MRVEWASGIGRKWRAVPKQLEKLFFLHWVITHFDYVRYVVEEAEMRQVEARRLREQLGMPEQGPAYSPHPNWKDAVLWMEEYGIVLVHGGAGSKYLARLPKDRWEHDISPDADPRWFSSWLLRKPEEVDDICAWARWPEIAVAQCVLNAKKSGVI